MENYIKSVMRFIEFVIYYNYEPVMEDSKYIYDTYCYTTNPHNFDKPLQSIYEFAVFFCNNTALENMVRFVSPEISDEERIAYCMFVWNGAQTQIQNSPQ
jgi:hypothetical protein